MDKHDILSQLRGNHLPEPVGWWPPAIGWWLLLFVGIIVFALSVYGWRRQKTRYAYRKYARRELVQMRHEINDSQQFAAASSALLKRAARCRYGNSVANLHSQAWLEFLQKKAPRCDQAVLTEICIGQYKTVCNASPEQIYQTTEQWLRSHR